MKVAISSDGNKEDSRISEVSGRAPYYLIFENGKLKKVVKNPFRIGGGAGFSVAAMLADEKVDIVVSGKFGPNMTSSLKEKGIKYKEMHNVSVSDVLNEVEQVK